MCMPYGMCGIFHRVGSRDQAQACRLASRCPYHLDSSTGNSSRKWDEREEMQLKGLDAQHQRGCRQPGLRGLPAERPWIS